MDTNKKIRIAEYYIELLKENGIVPNYDGDYEITYGASRGLEISEFRFMLHKIVEIVRTLDEKQLHDEIHNNNFTNLIASGILEIV